MYYGACLNCGAAKTGKRSDELLTSTVREVKGMYDKLDVGLPVCWQNQADSLNVFNYWISPRAPGNGQEP